MTIISFNVNGLQASIKKGLLESIQKESPDIICLQETKCQIPILEIENYFSYWNYSSKRSYSGTAVFTKIEPIHVEYGFPENDFLVEGRLITLEYKDYYLVNAYFPNSRSGLNRIDYRMEWDELFYDYILNLEKKKPVIICGDLNVALYKKEALNIEKNYFINNELDTFYQLLEMGYVDAYKYKYPSENSCTWWNRTQKEQANATGYRLDYFLVSPYLSSRILDSKVLNTIYCSDHFPVTLEINF